MFFEIIMIILGFILLVCGADLLVKGSSNIAKKFHIPEMLIGLTIVAIGTSAPELIITITSAGKDASDLILGNAIGSNLCNLLLILGLMAVLRPVEIGKDAKKIHIPILLLSTLILFIMQIGIFGGGVNVLDRIAGIILIILFILYFSYPILTEIKDIKKAYKDNKDKQINNSKTILSVIFVIIGIVLLKYGGDFVVDYSIEIARRINISERVIGLTIVAIGTALPELVTSIFAVIKKDTDLAVGNIVGSCIFNTFLILGIGAIMTPLKFSTEFNQNLIILLASTVLIWLFNFVGKKDMVTRTKGCTLLLIFGIYIFKLFI